MSRDKSMPRPGWCLRLTAALFVVAGLLLGVPDARLILPGGSPWYASAGLALAIAGALLWSERMSGAWLFAGVLLDTGVGAMHCPLRGQPRRRCRGPRPPSNRRTRPAD
jgi:hypothetical protein